MYRPKTKEQRRHGSKNQREGEEALEVLVAWDYEVLRFSEWHFRVNRRLDVWPVSRKWYDNKTHRKGIYPKGELESFVKEFLH